MALRLLKNCFFMLKDSIKMWSGNGATEQQ